MPPFIAHPLWLALPLVTLALLFMQPARGRLPGGWSQLIGETLQSFLARDIAPPARDWRRMALALLWCLLAVMLAKISFGFNKTPELANLYARVLVIDLGASSEREQILAARNIIQQYPEVPTGLVAVTEQAYDVVPITTDRRNLDRYLEVLSAKLMPANGRRPERGLQRAALLLQRGQIMAGQIVMYSAGDPPANTESVAALTKRYGLWIVAASDNTSAWRAYGRDVGSARIRTANQNAGALSTHTNTHEAIAAELEDRRVAAATDAASIRERRELTPWLILLSLPLWLLLFFRRGISL